MKIGILAAPFLVFLAVCSANPPSFQEIQKAAKQGDAKAQFNLGTIYAEGRGVPRDYIAAYMWYSLAAARGEEIARTALNSMEEVITQEQRTEAQRLALEWKPKKP